MARLIEIDDAAACPSPLALRVGDVVLLRAAGARPPSGDDCIELLGPFIPAVLGDNAEILSPMGSPGTLLVVARRPGRASFMAIGGDPFHAPRATELSISVELA